MYTPFNGVFFLLSGICVLLMVLSFSFLKGKSQKTKSIFMYTLCAFNLAFYWVYKGMLSVDKDYLVIAELEAFNWFAELPLQLCNVNMMLIPLGIGLKNRFIMGFSFYTAPLGAAMALIFPDVGFYDCSLFIPRVFGYVGTHYLIIMSGLLLCILGFYQPKTKDLPGVTVTVAIVALLAHGINLLLRISLCPHANYLYTFGADISILKLFYDIIPIPFVYEIPLILILLAYMGLISLFFNLMDIIKSKHRRIFRQA